MPRRLVYHYPFRVREQTSGSQVHIVQMLEAFERLGYQVELVSGTAHERRRTLNRLANDENIARSIDFVYAWAPTAPSLLGRGNQSRPTADLEFFRWCKKTGLPIGLFCGDVHWRFDHYRKNTGLAHYLVAIPLFRYDWIVYGRYIDYLFLPSLRMADFLPGSWPADKMGVLLPGCNPFRNLDEISHEGRTDLQLFYVGGVVPPLYDLQAMVKLVNGLEGIRLTLCCREGEWAQVRDRYEPFDRAKIRVVHAHGSELQRYYAEADIFGLYWQPHPYLRITMPVKVIESLGYGLPILTTSGTVAAEFVTNNRIGWTVSDDEEFRRTLLYLRDQRSTVEGMASRCRQIRYQHTWEKRAELVADTLTRLAHSKQKRA